MITFSVIFLIKILKPYIKCLDPTLVKFRQLNAKLKLWLKNCEKKIKMKILSSIVILLTGSLLAQCSGMQILKTLSSHKR